MRADRSVVDFYDRLAKRMKPLAANIGHRTIAQHGNREDVTLLHAQRNGMTARRVQHDARGFQYACCKKNGLTLKHSRHVVGCGTSFDSNSGFSCIEAVDKNTGDIV